MTIRLGNLGMALASGISDADKLPATQLLKLAVEEGLSFQRLTGIRKRPLTKNPEAVMFDERTSKRIRKSGFSAQELAVMGLLLFLELEQDHESGNE